jgi:sugar/nucleoside kinase (ribokinase family)
VADIIAIGETNLDLIVTDVPRLPGMGQEVIVGGMQLTLGGSTAIFACQVARLGDEVTFISKVGGDEFGRQALAYLGKRGVPTQAVSVDDAVATGLTIAVSVGPDRFMFTHLGCIEEVRWEDIGWDLVRQGRHLHIGAYYLQRKLRPDVARIFARAHELGLTTSLDTGWPAEATYAEELDRVWPHLDVLLPNGEEAKVLSGEDAVERALASLASRVPTVAIKLGEDGAIAQHRGEVVRSPGLQVDVVDTTGAGDSFDGGFLHAYLAGDSLDKCLALGNACGALSTRASGGTASQPDLAEAFAFIEAAPRRG